VEFKKGKATKPTSTKAKTSIKNPEQLTKGTRDGTDTILVMPDGTVHSAGSYSPGNEAYTHSSFFNDLLANEDKYSPHKGELYTELEQVEWDKFMKDGGIRAAATSPDSAYAQIEDKSPKTIQRALDTLQHLGRKRSGLNTILQMQLL